MTTSTTGTTAIGKPTDCARSSRKASLNRAKVKMAATPTIIQ